jgi:hypothetical protein
MKFPSPIYATAALLLCAGLATANDDWTELLGYVPASANTLIVIDVPRVLNSPVAWDRGWKRDAPFRFAEGAILLPSDTVRVAMASRWDFSSIKPTWEVLAMDVDEHWSDQRMVRAARGFLDPVGKVDAVWSPFDAYYVRLGYFRIGAVSPANRQRAARWAQNEPKVSMTPYLAAGAQRVVDGKYPMVLAVDMADAIDSISLRETLADLPSLASKKVDRDALAKLLATVRGLTMSVAFGGPPPSITIQIDLGGDASPLDGIAAELFRDLASTAGMALEEPIPWQTRIEGKSVVVQGPLTDAAIRRLSMLIRLHPPEDIGKSVKGDGKEISDLQVVQRQFATVTMLIEDLKLKSRSGGEYGPTAVWIERYAREIEALPVEGVDGTLVNYRFEVATSLRKIVKELETGVRSEARMMGRKTVIDPKGNYRQKDLSDDEMPVRKEAQKIIAQTLRVRKTLSDRYGVPF